jgi:hypothetical protein
MVWLAQEIKSYVFGHIGSDEKSFKTLTLGVKVIKLFSSSPMPWQIIWSVFPFQLFASKASTNHIGAL